MSRNKPRTRGGGSLDEKGLQVFYYCPRCTPQPGELAYKKKKNGALPAPKKHCETCGSWIVEEGSRRCMETSISTGKNAACDKWWDRRLLENVLMRFIDNKIGKYWLDRAFKSIGDLEGSPGHPAIPGPCITCGEITHHETPDGRPQCFNCSLKNDDSPGLSK